MTRTFKLVCGSDEIDLIDIGTTDAFKLRRGGAGQTQINQRVRSSSNELTEQTRTKGVRALPITERYRLNFEGTSHDETAEGIQALFRILAKGERYHYKAWEFRPLYLQQQTTNETNPRYSLILSMNSLRYPDLFNQPFEADNDLDNIQLQITREPYWRDTPPQVLPDKLPMLSAGMEFFDSVTGAVSYIGEAAYLSAFGASFVADFGTVNYGTIDLPSAETTFVLEFRLNIEDYIYGAGDIQTIVRTFGAGAGGISYSAWLVDGDLYVQAITDAGGGTGTQSVTVTNGAKYKIVWIAASAPAANDGALKLYENDILIGEALTIDNDTRDIDTFSIGNYTGADASHSGYLYFDDIKWADADDAVWHRTIDFEYEYGLIPNALALTGLDTFYIYDASGPAFSANLIDSLRWGWWSKDGAVPAAGDIMYFGSDEPFHSIAFSKDTGQMSPTLFVEYSIGGAAWTNLPNHLLLGTDFDDYSGPMLLKFAGDATWAKDTINGDLKYWIRIRLAGLTFVSQAYHDGFQVFQPEAPYIELSSKNLTGDRAALIMARFFKLRPTELLAEISDIYAGFKSTGLTYFTSRYNAGGDNPAWITTNYGADTSAVADPVAPNGNKAVCTFATQAGYGVGPRVQSLILAASADITDYEGTYRVFCRAKQSGGVAGDVELRSVLSGASLIYGNSVPMKGNSSVELVDLGTFSIFSLRTIGEDEAALTTNISFGVDAKSNNGATPNVEIHDVILLPIDELAVHLSTDSTLQLLDEEGYVQADSGVIRIPGSISGEFLFDSWEFAPAGTWQTLGEPIQLQPGRRGRLYFLMSDHAYTTTTASRLDMGLKLVMYAHQLFRMMIGDQE
jgi:hypothetical protein